MEDNCKYQKGKIYRIWSQEIDNIYVGSTVEPLHKRMYRHKLDAKQYTTYRLYQEMNRLGDYMFRIELIEDYPCNNRSELHKREGYWIRELKAKLNMRIAGRTPRERYRENIEEITIRQKLYRDTHKESIATHHKKYLEANREQLSQQRKSFREANKERLQEVSRNYREKHKEQAQAKKSQSHICTICGKSYTNCHKARHERTKQHLQALEQQSN